MRWEIKRYDIKWNIKCSKLEKEEKQGGKEKEQM